MYSRVSSEALPVSQPAILLPPTQGQQRMICPYWQARHFRLLVSGHMNSRKTGRRRIRSKEYTQRWRRLECS